MKQLRVWIAMGAFATLIAVSIFASGTDAQEGGHPDLSGGSYLTTIRDSEGNFASRSVITLHADHTMSAIDSGQGGPTFFFTSQRGSWKPNGSRRVAATAFDFPLPPNGPGIARADYAMDVATDRRSVAGTSTFTFLGELITP